MPLLSSYWFDDVFDEFLDDDNTAAYGQRWYCRCGSSLDYQRHEEWRLGYYRLTPWRLGYFIDTSITKRITCMNYEYMYLYVSSSPLIFTWMSLRSVFQTLNVIKRQLVKYLRKSETPWNDICRSQRLYRALWRCHWSLCHWWCKV